MKAHIPKMFRITLFLSVVTLASLVWTDSHQPTPPPDVLYLFDVTDLHINHYDYCQNLITTPGEPCPISEPPPAGKTHQQLLQEYDTLTLLTTLQGIVNQQAPHLYLIHDRKPSDEIGVDQFWLEKYQEPNQPYNWLINTTLIELNSVDEVLELFAPMVNGLVLWDVDVPATLNVATTIAGVDGLAVLRHDSDITAQVTAYLDIKDDRLVGLFKPNATTIPGSNTPSTGSTKTDAHVWAIENYLETGLANAAFLAYYEDGWPAVRYLNNQMTRGGVYALERDYVVQQRGFAFDLSPFPDELPIDDPNQRLGLDVEIMEKLFKVASQKVNGGLIKVWGFIPWYDKYSFISNPQNKYHPTTGEWRALWLFSQYGGYLQGGAGDVYGIAMSNVSVHKFAPPPPPRTPPSPPSEESLIELGYLTPEGDISDEHTFIMFYMGDYDLVHTTHTLLANHGPAPWVDEKRGDIPLAWGFNPAMIEEIPAMMTYFYTTHTEQDYFVGANSGAGYTNPDALSQTTYLRWLWRSYQYFDYYGYDIMGFMVNGDGGPMSQRRIDAFARITPVGFLSLDLQTDEPWPRYQAGMPLTTIPLRAFGGTPDSSAELVDQIYGEHLAENRPPFMAFRSSFLSTSFHWEIRERLKARNTEGITLNENGQVLYPNYTVVDPYTFFFLLERWLAVHG